MSSFVEFQGNVLGIGLSGTPTSFNCITVMTGSRHSAAVERVTDCKAGSDTNGTEGSSVKIHSVFVDSLSCLQLSADGS